MKERNERSAWRRSRKRSRKVFSKERQLTSSTVGNTISNVVNDNSPLGRIASTRLVKNGFPPFLLFRATFLEFNNSFIKICNLLPPDPIGLNKEFHFVADYSPRWLIDDARFKIISKPDGGSTFGRIIIANAEFHTRVLKIISIFAFPPGFGPAIARDRIFFHIRLSWA